MYGYIEFLRHLYSSSSREIVAVANSPKLGKLHAIFITAGLFFSLALRLSIEKRT